MKRELGLSALAGLASAVLFLSVFAGGGIGIVLLYMAPLPLMALGLCFGFPLALTGSGVGFALVGAMSLSMTPTYVIVAALPTAVVVRQALLWRERADGVIDWYPPGLVLASLQAAALGLLFVGVAILANGEDGIEAEIGRRVASFIDEVPLVAPAEMKAELVSLWASLLPAAAAAGWVVVAVLNGAMAQGVAVKTGHAMRPTPPFRDLEVPVWLMAAPGIAGIVWLANSGDIAYVAMNVVVLSLLPFVFVGLAGVHRGLGSKPRGGLWLAAFYTGFIVLFGWAIIAVAGLGLVECWTRRLRRRPDRGQEEE